MVRLPHVTKIVRKPEGVGTEYCTMYLPIDNEIMQSEESDIHMDSEVSIVVEALLHTLELFEATG